MTSPARFQFNPRERRNDYDVTNTVRVSSVDEVRNACQDLFLATWPGASFDQLWLAFHDFRRMFRGQAEGYIGCDTLYHDQQHSLDVTLAMARLLAGYEQTAPEADKLGHERAVVGLICALFHDSGYIRRVGERHRNGAEFTPYHISRSAEFLTGHLPRIGLGHWVPVVRQLVHFTGYEISLDDIELDDPKDSTVGHLLGTADLLAQMADRCYLEKCRDRLYGEFVLAGIAVEQKKRAGAHRPLRVWHRPAAADTGLLGGVSAGATGEELQPCLPEYRAPVRRQNPYLLAIDHNLRYLGRLLEDGNLVSLRRKPPVFTVLPNPAESVGALVSRHLANLNAPAASLGL